MSSAEHLQEAIDVGCTRDDHDHVADHRAEVLAEVTAWLLKKAREFGSLTGRENAVREEVLQRMASKIARGAVRPDNLRLPAGAAEKDTREGESTPALTVYRASHDSIVMGLYTTATEARVHCEAEERRSWPTGTNLSFDWIEDEGDGVAELVVVAGQTEESITGYVVTALEVASKYDPEADV
ncbi:hypothetical protein [Streptomyces lavendulocolor]|uniref:hypothetical protein n=1 Tax=Streptomyces lavendulocolor TaxID=67316 RepID=UPI003C2BBB69